MMEDERETEKGRKLNSEVDSKPSSKGNAKYGTDDYCGWDDKAGSERRADVVYVIGRADRRTDIGGWSGHQYRRLLSRTFLAE